MSKVAHNEKMNKLFDIIYILQYIFDILITVVDRFSYLKPYYRFQTKT